MKLIIINGSCGSGKSTLAVKLHNYFPLSFLLDIDAQRRFISQYREKKDTSGHLSIVVAKAILNACLDTKHDVILDKIILDKNVLDDFCGIAKKFGADIHEIILWAPKEIIMQRVEDRGWRKGGLLTVKKCESFWHSIDKLKDERPNAIIVNNEKLNKEDLFINVLRLLKIKK